jgi:hypothetical protein
VRRNVAVIRSRLKYLSLEAKEIVMQSFVRSLLIYFMTPLVASQILSLKEIDSLEKEYVREILDLPKDIKRDIIINVSQQSRPAVETIKRLSEQCKFTKYPRQ